MDHVKVTYRGPSGTYSVEQDGEWFEFQVGKELVVPDDLAEQLLDVEGHDFELGDEAMGVTTEEIPGGDDESDLDGVNASLT